MAQLVKNLSALQETAYNTGNPGLIPVWVRKIPWRRKWQHSPVFLHEKSHGQRSVAGYSSRGHKDLYTTTLLRTHNWLRTMFLLYYIWHIIKCFYLKYNYKYIALFYENIAHTIPLYWRRKCQPTPVLLAGESHGRGVGGL